MKKVRTDLAVLSFFVFGLVGSHMARSQSKRGVTPEDYFSFKFISDPRISPDGKAVVYVLTIVNQKKNHRESSIWLVPIDGSLTPRRLSAEGFNSNSPRGSPDGKTLAVISTRSTESSAADLPKPQIYLLPMAVRGEAMPFTKLKNGVQSYQWSPEGSRIVLVSSSGPVDNVAPANRKSDVRHYSHFI
jgi:dipeptidyl aminopeptidase/acylaminoacyl peptidase